MLNLSDFIEREYLNILCIGGKSFKGEPVDMNYADESVSGEDEIVVDVKDGQSHTLILLKQSEIESIEVLE